MSMATLKALAPVLPVSDVLSALDNYARLGFRAKPYQRGEVVEGRRLVEVLYGFVFRDGLQLHLCQVSGIDPVTNLSEVYLYVDDANALHEQWSASGAAGSTSNPQTLSTDCAREPTSIPMETRCATVPGSRDIRNPLRPEQA